MADRKRSVYDERAGIFPARFFWLSQEESDLKRRAHSVSSWQ
jgi:hypothetical protein